MANGRGRPRVYDGNDRRRSIAAAIKVHGLTGAMPVLAEKGINASVFVLRAVAKEKGIKLRRGRRAA